MRGPGTRGIVLAALASLAADCSEPPGPAPGPAPAPAPDALLDAIPTGPELVASNILYSGDISTAGELGRAVRHHHERIAAAMEEHCRALDAAYDDLCAANDRLLATVVAIRAHLGAAAPADDGPERRLLEMAVEERVLRESVLGLRRLAADRPGPASASIAKSETLLRLLRRYATATRLQVARATAVYSAITALHQSPAGPLSAADRARLAPLLRYEADAMDAALAAHARMLGAEAAIATGMTGIRELMRAALETGIRETASGLERAAAAVPAIASRPDRAGHAEVVLRAVQLHAYELQALKNAATALRAAAPSWYGYAKIVAYREEPGLRERLASADPFCGTAHAGAPDAFGSLATRTLGAMADAARTGAAAVATVAGVAADTARYSVAGVSAITKAGADIYYGASEGLSLGQIAEQVTATIDEHGEEIESGKAGAGAFARGIAAHEGVDKWAEETAAAGVGSLVGEGWLSWGAGKLAAAATGSVTSLGKGAMQIADPNATPGQIVAGTLNVATALFAGSSAFSGTAGTGLGTMLSSAGRGSREVASRGFAALAARFETQQARAELARQSARMANAAAGSVDDAMRVAYQESIAAFDRVVAGYQGSVARLGDELASFAPRACGEVSEAVSRQMGADIEKAGAEIVENWTRELTTSQAAIKVLEKLTGAQLVGGALDSMLIDAASAKVDSLIPAEKRAAPIGRPPAIAVPEAAASSLAGQLEQLETLVAQAAAAAPPAPAAAPPAREIVQGSVTGVFRGSLCSGSMTLTISGTSVSGTFSGGSPRHDTGFAGRFVDGSYDHATGAIRARMQGSRWYAGSEPDQVDVSLFKGEVRGSFSGAQAGNGFEGTWSGNAGKDDSGSWSVSGGRLVPIGR